MSKPEHDMPTAPDAPLSPDDLRRLGKVAVLMGGDSAEREVSLMSGDGVLQALQSEGVQAYAFDPAERPLSELKAQGFARCFIALHGRRGEDGSLQGALEMLRIPYTGPGVMASAIAMDKVMSKRLWSTFGLPMPRQVVLDPSQHVDSHTRLVPDDLGLPLIVKPAREGSSIGVTKVEGYSQMAEAVRLAAHHDGQVLCEEFIEGDEVTCALLGAGAGAHALPVIRIVPPTNGSYDYQNKYFTDVTTYVVPNALAPEEEAEVQRVSLQAYRALGCRGWSRADLIVRKSDRRVFLLEMNTSPGMTGHSLVPMAAKAAGISYGQLCVHLVAQAALDD